ncbi:MAG: response regulator transcription factor [bacterium]
MRLLIVEDDKKLAAFLERSLSEGAHSIETVFTYADAIAVLSFKEFDGVLVDLNLPDGSGVDIIRQIRRRESDIPVLVLTGRADPQDVVVALDAGADDYVTKPFSSDVLKARVRALMRRGGPRRIADLRVGALTLSRATSVAQLGDVDLQLTLKEFALLAHLAQNVGRMVGKAELLEHVWGTQFDPGSNVVNVTIGRLRKKLKAGPGHPQIITRRFAGFTLQLPGEKLSPDADVYPDEPPPHEPH